MDLNDAIAAHTQWKMKFRLAITNKEQLDASSIVRDNCCELGKWLEGDAKSRFGALPAYQRVAKAHTAFHAVAGRIGTSINQKQYEAATALLNSQEYVEASGDVGASLILLKRATGL